MQDSYINFDIKEELKKLPQKPGVYLMHGPGDEIIYVGKAVNLKNRVRQYFQSPQGKTAKILKMISLIRRFEYIVVDSELEALVLENNLIKENRPKYNTLLKDDKTYPYIRVSTDEAFPRITKTRKAKKDKARYFGPFTNETAVRECIDLLHKLFKIRTCNRNLPKDIGKERPCLYYHLGQCSAPCAGEISEEEYAESIEHALDFLSGKYDYVKSYLTSKMEECSENLEFERAIEYRELIKNIDAVTERQKVSYLDNDDRDIIGIAAEGSSAVAQVFFIRGGRLIGREHFFIDTDPNDTLTDITESFLNRYYTGTPFIPKEIRIQCDIPQRELMERWLSEAKGQRVHINVPKKGSGEKLVELAVKNAETVLQKDKEKLKREELRTIGAMNEIKDLLGLYQLQRVESYDISNTNGYESVGSMVVFEDGRPKRNDYRKFKIKTVAGPDDYASMREVLMRRFSHGLREKESLNEAESSETGMKFSKFPDLIMMDGGKGQVNIALKVLAELGQDIPVCGMVKDDRHRTRGLYFDNKEIAVDSDSEAFKLITRIQDETHRFAIEYHKSLRSKAQVRSVLDDIPGVGKVRRRALMRTFKDIESIRNAGVEELMEIPEFDRRSAQSVYDFFRQEKSP
ncbi:MAG: excinuclease ABC subunit UvrC [Candidatus Avilachnospira sp.]